MSETAAIDATIWTVGHSTRSLEEFLALLSEHQIEAIADVRRFPGSRRFPQFGQEELRASLEQRGIAYLWLPSMGGRRDPAPDSPNTAWRNPAFRGYADHMETDEFATGLDELLMCGLGVRTAVMCAEAVWWRCHRGLIADALCLLGIQVRHILEPGKAPAHPLTPPARIRDGSLSYQREETDLNLGL